MSMSYLWSIVLHDGFQEGKSFSEGITLSDEHMRMIVKLLHDAAHKIIILILFPA